MTDITPSDTQARAIAAIKDWFKNRTKRAAGVSGCSAMPAPENHRPEIRARRAWARSAQERVATAANACPGVVTATFTGKAALVLRRKGTPARTIHSLIYSVIVATDEEIEAAGKKIDEAEQEAASSLASIAPRPRRRSRPCARRCRR